MELSSVALHISWQNCREQVNTAHSVFYDNTICIGIYELFFKTKLSANKGISRPIIFAQDHIQRIWSFFFENLNKEKFIQWGCITKSNLWNSFSSPLSFLRYPTEAEWEANYNATLISFDGNLPLGKCSHDYSQIFHGTPTLSLLTKQNVLLTLNPYTRFSTFSKVKESGLLKRTSLTLP